MCTVSLTSPGVTKRLSVPAVCITCKVSDVSLNLREERIAYLCSPHLCVPKEAWTPVSYASLLGQVPLGPMVSEEQGLTGSPLPTHKALLGMELNQGMRLVEEIHQGKSTKHAHLLPTTLIKQPIM